MKLLLKKVIPGQDIGGEAADRNLYIKLELLERLNGFRILKESLQNMLVYLNMGLTQESSGFHLQPNQAQT